MHRDKDSTQTIPLVSRSDRLRAGPHLACVVVIHGEGLGKRVDIGEKPIIIGRSPDVDLPIPHPSVSRQHCRIWRQGSEYHVADLGATNPTLLNDHPIIESELQDGDHITLGESILKFISGSSVEAMYHLAVYQLATHDTLTELANRRHFVEQLDKELAGSLRSKRPLCLCIVDVDLFKRVNDTYGHIAGDGVLKQMAAVMRQHVRASEVAARIGGEEFAILLPETGL